MSEAGTVVVGAGISGLACATELLANGCSDLCVLEAAPRAGGPAETVRLGAYLVERGPNTVRANEALAALIERAGLAPVEARRAPPAFVADGKVVVLPPSLRALLSGELLPFGALLGVLAEPLRPVRRGPRTVRQLVEERLGAAAADRLADLITLGVYGTSADRIGFEAAFPELAARLDAAGGRFTGLVLRSLRGRGPRPQLVSTELGLGGLCRRLAERLGARLRTSCAVRRARKSRGGFELELDGGEKLACERLVLAIPPGPAARVLELPSASALLEGYPSLPQVLATFALEEPACAERWQVLGILAPARERLPFIGCLMPSNLFPNRAPAGALLLSVFCASALHGASDAALARELAPALKRLLDAAREPVLLDVARWPQGIPLYDVAHPQRTRALRECLRAEGGPVLCGVGYDGVAFAAAAASGVAAAREMLR
ncbi:MAG TPA: protoporphyrinogen oxidase [Myxococcota bacterium]|nr:protoporphyrinogen oxidase [Myxococcota bacterium]